MYIFYMVAKLYKTTNTTYNFKKQNYAKLSWKYNHNNLW